MTKIIAIALLTFLVFTPTAYAQSTNIKNATFAGGCFWCMEGPFDEVKGVVSTTSGYIGGKVDNPNYGQVSRGETGHAEAVQIKYDANKVSYQKLLDIFWINIDPTVKNRQFCDKGSQYRTGIFYHDSKQQELALASKEKAERKLKAKVFTEVVSAKKFYPAEDYHQDYYIKNPLRYKYYRFACGRDQRLEEIWGKSATQTH